MSPSDISLWSQSSNWFRLNVDARNSCFVAIVNIVMTSWRFLTSGLALSNSVYLHQLFVTLLAGNCYSHLSVDPLFLLVAAGNFGPLAQQHIRSQRSTWTLYSRAHVKHSYSMSNLRLAITPGPTTTWHWLLDIEVTWPIYSWTKGPIGKGKHEAHAKPFLRTVLAVSAVLVVPNFTLFKHHMEHTILKMLVLLQASKLGLQLVSTSTCFLL